MKRIVTGCIALLLSVFSFSCFAGWYASVGGGLTTLGLNNGNVIVSSSATDTIEPKGHHAGLVLSASVGHAWALHYHYIKRISLAFTMAYLHRMLSKGDVLAFGTLRNYHYRVFVSGLRTLLNLQLNFMSFHGFSPFTFFGAGIAFNHGSAYSSTLIPGTGTIQGDHFAAKTAAQFAYQIGVGSDYRINKTTQVAFGYRFVDLGEMKLRNVSQAGTSFVRGPRLPLHSHEIFVSIEKTFNV